MRQFQWDVLLNEVVLAARTQQFGWGAFDCCTFSADCYRAVTGIDLRPSIPVYESAIGALAAIQGYGGMAEMVDSMLGAARVHPAFAKRGDLVLGQSLQSDAFGGSLGICLGVHCAFVAEVGLVMQERSIVSIAWSVD